MGPSRVLWGRNGLSCRSILTAQGSSEAPQLSEAWHGSPGTAAGSACTAAKPSCSAAIGSQHQPCCSQSLGNKRGTWRHPQKFISPTIRIMKPQKQSLNIYKVIQRPTEIKGTKEGEMEGWPPPKSSSKATELCSGGKGGESKTGRTGTEPTFVAEGWGHSEGAGREMGHAEGCTSLVRSPLCHLPALGTSSGSACTHMALCHTSNVLKQ